MFLSVGSSNVSGRRFEGKSQCHAWVSAVGKTASQRVGPLTEPNDAMALEVPMEGWFSLWI